MAAIFAASRGASVALVERTRDGGRKILISGGGRCNVLPARLDESRFVTDSSPNTLRKLLRAWPLREQIQFFEQELGIPLVEEPEAAKLFPVSNRARDVRDGLLAYARSRGVSVSFDTRVTNIVPSGTRWRVEVESGKLPEADAVIVATGGLSVPNTGSDGTGLRILERLGHVVNPTYPALTPITSEPAPFAELSGVSQRVTITAKSERRSATSSGGFLFTHRGYSGPSVLDVSHVVARARLENESARLTVRWTGHEAGDWESLLRDDAGRGKRSVASVLRAEIPERLAAALLVQAGVSQQQTLAELSRDGRRRLVQTLVAGEVPWTGDEGYKKAEVTGGGVSLAEVDPRTMESRRHSGLYLCGEVLDAFGPIGGNNFYWAWSTGRAAGLAAGAGAV